MLKRMLLLLSCLLILTTSLAESDTSMEEVGETVVISPGAAEVNEAREDLINRIIALGEKIYNLTGGRAMKAHDSDDIFICKNFTTYIFHECRYDFRIAEYPGVLLVCPENMPDIGCYPYEYGLMWKNVRASEGNAFYAAAEFRYNAELSYEENLALAEEFMRQVKRGDFFQMAADYYYGTGAHSAIMTADYDPATDSVRWIDSNMVGTIVDGVRYGYVQFDREKSVTWWAEAFCHKGRGATIYRLRDDIIYAD